jgi:hypothetical protein
LHVFKLPVQISSIAAILKILGGARIPECPNHSAYPPRILTSLN